MQWRVTCDTQGACPSLGIASCRSVIEIRWARTQDHQTDHGWDDTAPERGVSRHRKHVCAVDQKAIRRTVVIGPDTQHSGNKHHRRRQHGSSSDPRWLERVHAFCTAKAGTPTRVEMEAPRAPTTTTSTAQPGVYSIVDLYMRVPKSTRVHAALDLDPTRLRPAVSENGRRSQSQHASSWNGRGRGPPTETERTLLALRASG